ncbi:phosphogluconate dehydrogenase (NAD(+)-dependent, decarboxylating) [Nitrosospira briensis]|uniref:phosphogluconate dehydrogenase (NAD(+)-dependent, decarboxylating) n=1 Tax=Nitrosospira briensis TaxID=35799 RepID=UPI0008ED5B02|nr:decarboxylating 6-phosphogluconate dehydrogenase [Nitrosospira briensis]SFO22592.1 6-phosphogluconate dehydrogenase (decarboxylating) [Nitrosospira briensis]
MDLGMIGMGRMGGPMAQRLLRDGHRVTALARSRDAFKQLEEKGVVPVESLEELVNKLKPPRIVWLMIPAGAAVDDTVGMLSPLLTAGDVIVDGGNSNYKDTQRRSQSLAAKGIHFVDSGTSGGVWGLENGYSIMVGGDEGVVERLRPIFESLAPAPDKGWGHVGPSGAGHFTKMVHNGIEYGMMQAYGEGFAIMRHKKEFNLDLHQVAEIWRDGSVVQSWLLDLTAAALSENPDLEGIAPYVADSGEGRWTVAEAIDLNVAAPVITLALLQRLQSRDSESFSNKMLSALRNQFGGHEMKKQ